MIYNITNRVKAKNYDNENKNYRDWNSVMEGA
jgi:hypothetical protein